jgi:hypothetical protein
VHRHGMEDPLHWGVTGLAGGDGSVGHPLHDLEEMPVVAPVFVDRHRAQQYRRAPERIPAEASKVRSDG